MRVVWHDQPGEQQLVPWLRVEGLIKVGKKREPLFRLTRGHDGRHGEWCGECNTYRARHGKQKTRQEV